MKEFIVRANGSYLSGNITVIVIALVMYIGFPILEFNYYKKNHDQLMTLCVLMLLSYFVATALMYLGVIGATQTIKFNESDIVIQRAFKSASFSKKDVTYDIGDFRSSMGVHQQETFIKAGGKVYIIKEKEVINYPRAVEYLQNNCNREEIRK